MIHLCKKFTQYIAMCFINRWYFIKFVIIRANMQTDMLKGITTHLIYMPRSFKQKLLFINIFVHIYDKSITYYLTMRDEHSKIENSVNKICIIYDLLLCVKTIPNNIMLWDQCLLHLCRIIKLIWSCRQVYSDQSWTVNTSKIISK